jgi:hypothetical protein
MNRRDFIKTGICAAAAVGARKFGFAAAGVAAMPNILRAGSKERVRMGFIGVGNRGTQLLHIFMKNPRVEVTALCDVYEPNLRRDDSAFDPKFLEWDAEAERFVNCDEANALLHYKYRDGYTLG